MYNLLKVLFKIINFYTQHFRFPHRGWKYMRSLLRILNLDNKLYRKKILPGTYLYVNPTDHIQQQLFWYGYYEKDAILLWQQLVHKDSCVIDIGANIGYYSVVAAYKTESGRVYAFEPLNEAYGQLLQNINTNKFTNIQTYPVAVTNLAGKELFYISGPDNTGMSGLKQADNFSGNTEMITTVLLDDWIKNIHTRKIDLIKMDIEGAEMNALYGMQDIIKQYQPVFFIEINQLHLQKFGYTPSQVYHFLFSLGYAAYMPVSGPALIKLTDSAEADTIIFAPLAYRFPAGLKISG